MNRICILGGAGFIGRQLIEKLHQSRVHVRVPTRSKHRHRDLLVYPSVELVQANVMRPEQLSYVLQDCDAVINLIGILNERGNDGSGFKEAHVNHVERLIGACHLLGVPRLLHMSALNADAEHGPSHYLRSKGQAEQLLRKAQSKHLAITMFRPSIVFGEDDAFTNRFVKLAKLMPGVFPLACPHARFAPTHVNDVASAMLKTLDSPASYGKTYELCGPTVYSFKELLEELFRVSQLGCVVMPLNDGLARLQARVMGLMPGKPFSMDNYLSLTKHSLCEQPGYERLNIEPASLAAIVPSYLSPDVAA